MFIKGVGRSFLGQLFLTARSAIPMVRRMSKLSPKPLKGMSDISSPEVEIWQALEYSARSVLDTYTYTEVRTPILEPVAVYTHSLGDTTDIVQKQMYAFERGSEQLCLRPEGTAGVIRYVSGLGPDGGDARLYYMGPMFRSERPQAGRRRQFHQLGVEAIVEPSPFLDAEVVAMQAALFSAWGIDGVEFQLNTRGSVEDFPRVVAGIRSALETHRGDLCEDCQRRMDQNVLRVLDCKVPICKGIVDRLPKITNFMSDESLDYFRTVCEQLDSLGVTYRVNPLLVRGLDYYQHTIWEVTSSAIGAQDALSGGGRYVMDMGGKKPVEGVGFGIGMERVIMALSDERKASLTRKDKPLICLVSIGDEALQANMQLAAGLRDSGCRVSMDLSGRSMKSQMKRAGKMDAAWVAICGDSELAAGVVQLKNMAASEQSEMPATLDTLLAAIG